MRRTRKAVTLLCDRAGNWLDDACESIDRTMTMWASAAVLVGVPFLLYKFGYAYGVWKGWWLP